MLNIKRLETDPKRCKELLERRHSSANIDKAINLSIERRSSAKQYETLRHAQKKSGSFLKDKSLSKEQRDVIHAELKEMSRQVVLLQGQTKEIEKELHRELLNLPNIPDPKSPIGKGEEDNVEIRTWGEPFEMPFTPKEHDELGEHLGILDFEAARKISGSRFALYKKQGAELERALLNLMLNTHIESGYEEILPPYLVRQDSMVGTGQLPKFKEDAFKCEEEDLYLIPTAEVPVTNIHRDEILDIDQLPIKYCAYSSCFRREAGSHGKDTRGLTRLHQFQKVEMVVFTKPEDSEQAHQELTLQAEKILQVLGLPYRVVELCSGDLGFSAQRCFDIEVWLPGQGIWREISSCSNFGEFQARRASIRYRPETKSKPEYVHTLNGSGLAIGRCVMAIIENYQQEDGSILIPEALRPYMRNQSLITK